MTNEEKEGLKKLYLQIVFIIFLILIFTVDKVMWYIKPPLTDIWYIIMLSLAVWIDPNYIIWYFIKKDLPDNQDKKW